MADLGPASAPSVYLCFAPASRERAKQLADALLAAGLKLADLDAPCPADAVVIVCWTPAACVLDDIAVAAMQARSRQKLIQTILAPCRPPPPFGGRWTTADLGEWQGDPKDPAFAALVEIARARIEGRPPKLHVMHTRLLRWGGGGALAAGALVLTMNFGALKQVYDGFFNPGASEQALKATNAKVDAVLVLLKGQNAADPTSETALRSTIAALLSAQSGARGRASEKLEKGDLDGALGELKAATGEGEQAIKSVAQSWKELGALNFYEHTEDAITAYERAVALTPDDPEARLMVGALYQHVGRLADAQTGYRHILALPDVADHWRGDTYEALGGLQRLQGDNDAAADNLKAALELKRRLGDRLGQATQLSTLAVMAEEAGDIDAAIANYQRSVALQEGIENPFYPAMQMADKGALARAQGKFEESADWYARGFAVAEKAGDIEGMALTRFSIANAQTMKKDFAAAEISYLAAADLYGEADDAAGRADSYSCAAYAARERKDFKAAAAHAKLARDGFLAAGLDNSVAEMDDLLKDVAGKSAKPKRAQR